MEGKKSSVYMIGGILFAYFAVRQIYFMIRGGFGIWGLLWLVAYALIAAGALMGKKSPLPVAGFALSALLEIRTIIANLGSGYMYRMENYRTGRVRFSLFSFLPTLISFAAIVLAVLFAAALMMNIGPKEQAQKLWYAPAGLLLAAFVLSLLLMIVSRISGRLGFMWLGYYYMGLTNTLLFTIPEIAAYALLFMGMKNLVDDQPVIASYQPMSAGGYQAASYQTAGYQTAGYQTTNHQTAAGQNNQGGTVMNAQNEKYYCSLVKHILLLLFTFGIWMFIWVYRMTEYLNGAEGEQRRTPTNQLLLCMFVPFYIIYWTYQSAQRIDKMAHAKGVESDLTMLCLILEIFVAIVPPVLMQEKVNAILTAPAGAAPIVAKPVAPQPAPAPAYQAPAYQPAPAAAPAYQPAPAAAPATGAADEILKFKELLDMGAITEEEFTMKKRQILGLPVEQPAAPVVAQPVAQPVIQPVVQPVIQPVASVDEFDDLPEL